MSREISTRDYMASPDIDPVPEAGQVSPDPCVPQQYVMINAGQEDSL